MRGFTKPADRNTRYEWGSVPIPATQKKLLLLRPGCGAVCGAEREDGADCRDERAGQVQDGRVGGQANGS